jgi:hypothetical protein
MKSEEMKENNPSNIGVNNRRKLAAKSKAKA